jgi:hypothetical protein
MLGKPDPHCWCDNHRDLFADKLQRSSAANL